MVRRGELGYALFLLGIIAVLAWFSTPVDTGDGVAVAVAPGLRSVSPDALPSLPPLPPDAVPTRILPPVTGVPAGPHSFLVVTADGRPVTYDPCRPIHYVINPTGMPNRGLEVVREAVREISAATGLAFVEDGVTLEEVVEIREPLQPERYGDRWVPVLIGWVDEVQYPLVSGEILGVGGSTEVGPTGPGSERYVTGDVALDREWFVEALADPSEYGSARAVVMHELGHVVGLDHVADPREVMAEWGTTITELGPGDRQGLAAVGAGRCWTDT